MDLQNQTAASAIDDQVAHDFLAGSMLTSENVEIPGNPPRKGRALPATGRRAAVDVGGPVPPNEPRRPAVEPAATFFDVVLEDLAWQIQHDSRTVALLQQDVIDRFLEIGAHSTRLHVLPDASRPEEVSRALAWCQRLAQTGRRPILVLTRGSLPGLFGQLRDKLCVASLPVQVVVVPEPATKNAGAAPALAGRERPSLAFLRLLPNMALAVPKDGWELRQMLRFAADHEGPVALQIPQGRLPLPSFSDFAADIVMGKAEVLEEGFEVGLIAVGSLVAPALKAAEVLSLQGVSAGVINARFIEPLDRSLICDVATHVRGLLTLEEETVSGGFGSAVLELLADGGISTPVTVSGAVGIPGSDADDEALVARIVHQALALVDRGNDASRGAPKANRKARHRRPAAGIDLFGFSSEALQREQDLVKSRRLSPDVEEWYALYSLVGERKRFLWQWCEQGAELTTLPCVPAELFPHVCQTKVLSIMLCVLLDDVADQRDREAFLEVLLKIVDGQALPDLAGCTGDERYYAEITRRLAEIYFGRVRNYPYYAAFEHLLRYDQFQYFNTMRYSQMLNRNLWLMNPIEHDLYLPHAMDMMSFATIDLMCTPQFPMEELGRLREALWHLQCMGRVGNLLSTWRREIGQQDYTSGVFARAVIEGDLRVEQLRPENYHDIETAIVEGGHERYYFGRWKFHRECFLARARDVHAVDLKTLLEGNDRFFLMHLGGRGLI
jgi:transketolase C-terminal domain/subunit